jgi:hypothetical protein
VKLKLRAWRSASLCAAIASLTGFIAWTRARVRHAIFR